MASAWCCSSAHCPEIAPLTDGIHFHLSGVRTLSAEATHPPPHHLPCLECSAHSKSSKHASARRNGGHLVRPSQGVRASTLLSRCSQPTGHMNQSHPDSTFPYTPTQSRLTFHCTHDTWEHGSHSSSLGTEGREGNVSPRPQQEGSHHALPPSHPPPPPPSGVSLYTRELPFRPPSQQHLKPVWNTAPRDQGALQSECHSAVTPTITSAGTA